MIVVIKTKGVIEPFRFKRIYKLQEDTYDYKIWFVGEWNTPRSFPKVSTESISIEFE